MRTKLNSRKVIITECNDMNEDFRKLYHIFRCTICPGMKYKVFEAYYKSQRLAYVSVTFFYDGPETIAGFCAAAFYESVINGRLTTIARSATGFLKQYQGNSLSKWKLYSKYMHYKLHHPFRKMILTIYASNPFIYGMVCKYTGIVYPRLGRPVPPNIIALKNALLDGNNLRKRELSPFVVKINFEVEKSDDEKKKMIKSNNVDVQFFVAQTGLSQCVTLLLIIPVSFVNILWCIVLMMKHAVVKRWEADKKRVQPLITKCSYLLNLLAKTIKTGKARYANSKGMRTLSE